MGYYRPLHSGLIDVAAAFVTNVSLLCHNLVMSQNIRHQHDFMSPKRTNMHTDRMLRQLQLRLFEALESAFVQNRVLSLCVTDLRDFLAQVVDVLSLQSVTLITW